MTQQEYQQEIDFIFNRFPSYQTVGKVAYKPGIETMEALDELLGHPHRSYRTIHVAGTNGKGSTSPPKTMIRIISSKAVARAICPVACCSRYSLRYP
jgi:dihydrofolate synthase/folylpolyglutamate synthase